MNFSRGQECGNTPSEAEQFFFAAKNPSKNEQNNTAHFNKAKSELEPSPEQIALTPIQAKEIQAAAGEFMDIERKNTRGELTLEEEQEFSQLIHGGFLTRLQRHIPWLAPLLAGMSLWGAVKLTGLKTNTDAPEQNIMPNQHMKELIRHEFNDHFSDRSQSNNPDVAFYDYGGLYFELGNATHSTPQAMIKKYFDLPIENPLLPNEFVDRVKKENYVNPEYQILLARYRKIVTFQSAFNRLVQMNKNTNHTVIAQDGLLGPSTFGLMENFLNPPLSVTLTQAGYPNVHDAESLRSALFDMTPEIFTSFVTKIEDDARLNPFELLNKIPEALQKPEIQHYHQQLVDELKNTIGEQRILGVLSAEEMWNKPEDDEAQRKKIYQSSEFYKVYQEIKTWYQKQLKELKREFRQTESMRTTAEKRQKQEEIHGKTQELLSIMIALVHEFYEGTPWNFEGTSRNPRLIEDSEQYGISCAFHIYNLMKEIHVPIIFGSGKGDRPWQITSDKQPERYGGETNRIDFKKIADESGISLLEAKLQWLKNLPVGIYVVGLPSHMIIFMNSIQGVTLEEKLQLRTQMTISESMATGVRKTNLAKLIVNNEITFLSLSTITDDETLNNILSTP